VRIDVQRSFSDLKWLTMARLGVIGALLQLAPHPGEAVAALESGSNGAFRE
jgi:hypothetical protein